jgi:uracil-DNA glycosylase
MEKLAGDAAEAGQVLQWLIAMGADEVIAESPINRFLDAPPENAALVAAAPVQAAPVLLRPALQTSVTTSLPGGENAAEVAAACRSLAELAQAVDGFAACGLRRTASHTCFLGGNLNAHVLVMGDRARDDEDREGKIFAGKNEALLTNMLKAIGLSIENVLLANFIPWRPPGNRMANDIEIRQCLPFAQRVLELSKPKIILSLGGLAGQYLCNGESSVARQRGKWQEASGTAFMATFHPAELLESPARKKLAWRDLQMLRSRMIETGFGSVVQS